MPQAPPKIGPSPVVAPLVDPRTGRATASMAGWLSELMARIGGPTGKPIIGDVAVFETTVNQSELASAASKAVLSANAGEQWKVRGILLSGAGTNFSGGDRTIAISDGTSTWTVIPAATLAALAAARWGDTGAPFPATAADMMTASAAGTSVSASYSGGTTDYTAGELTLAIIAERVA